MGDWTVFQPSLPRKKKEKKNDNKNKQTKQKQKPEVMNFSKILWVNTGGYQKHIYKIYKHS